MSTIKALKALVAERLAAATEDVLGTVEKIIMIAENRMLHNSEMSPKTQKTFVHQRLTVVAEEICNILEMMLAECEANVSYSCQQREIHQWKPLDHRETYLHTADRVGPTASTFEKEIMPEEGHRKEEIFPHQYQENAELQHVKEIQKELQTEHEREVQAFSEQPGNDQDLFTKRSEVLGKNKCSDKGQNDRPQSLKLKITKDSQKHTRNPTPTNTGKCCCRVCGKSFQYKRSFLKHVLKHEQNTDLCGVCGKHLESGKRLRLHLKTHYEDNSCRDPAREDQSDNTNCPEAERKDSDNDEESQSEDKHFDGNRELEMHLRSHTGEKPYMWSISEESQSEDTDSDKDKPKEPAQLAKLKSVKRAQISSKVKSKGKESDESSILKHTCKVCEKSFCYRASFLKHVKEEVKDANLCGVCGKHFESKESLSLHLQTYMATNNCEFCGKHFEGNRQLEMHLRTHTREKLYVCGFCDRGFNFKEYLKAHMRIHTGEKPFLCSVCGKGFRQRGTLKRHMRELHTEGKSLTCTFCCKVFINERRLKIHMKVHSTGKTYSCTVCDKSFRYSSTLDKHMLLHTGEKMYSCKICGRRFRQKAHVTQHESVHTGTKPFKCNVCDESFRQKATMENHMSRHTKLKPYKCLVCEKKFARKDSLRRHKKYHDRGNKER